MRATFDLALDRRDEDGIETFSGKVAMHVHSDDDGPSRTYESSVEDVGRRMLVRTLEELCRANARQLAGHLLGGESVVDAHAAVAAVVAPDPEAGMQLGQEVMDAIANALGNEGTKYADAVEQGVAAVLAKHGLGAPALA